MIHELGCVEIEASDDLRQVCPSGSDSFASLGRCHGQAHLGCEVAAPLGLVGRVGEC